MGGFAPPPPSSYKRQDADFTPPPVSAYKGQEGENKRKPDPPGFLERFGETLMSTPAAFGQYFDTISNPIPGAARTVAAFAQNLGEHDSVPRAALSVTPAGTVTEDLAEHNVPGLVGTGAGLLTLGALARGAQNPSGALRTAARTAEFVHHPVLGAARLIGELRDIIRKGDTPAATPSARGGTPSVRSSIQYYAEQPGGDPLLTAKPSESYYAGQGESAPPSASPEITPGMTPADLGAALRARFEPTTTATPAGAGTTTGTPAGAGTTTTTPTGLTVADLIRQQEAAEAAARTAAAPAEAPTPAEPPAAAPAPAVAPEPAPVAATAPAPTEPQIPPGTPPDQVAAKLKESIEQAEAQKNARAEEIRAANRAKPGGAADNMSRILDERGETPESIAAKTPAERDALWKSVGNEHRGSKYDPSSPTRDLALERLGQRQAAKAPQQATAPAAPPAQTPLEKLAGQIADAGISADTLARYQPSTLAYLEKLGVGPNQIKPLLEALRAEEAYRHGPLTAVARAAGQ